MIRTCVPCGQLFDGTHERCPRCERTLSSPTGPPALFEGRYLILKEIGRGGGGRVLLARDVLLQRRVAIKVLAQERPGQSAIDAFYREASALASVRSEHVAQVYAFGLAEEGYYFAMEFIEGSSLAHLVTEHARTGQHVPKHRGLTILRHVAQGLAAVHAAGVVHRDVKPANIVIEKHTGRAVLVDFGIAMHRGDVREDGVLWGTPSYMAPGRAGGGGRRPPPLDALALGCTPFELFTGRRPFRAEVAAVLLAQHVTEPPPLPSSERADLAFIDPIIVRALAKDPADRHESARAFAAAIDGALEGLERLEPASAPSAPRPAGASTAAVRVLIIDDDPVFAVFASRAVRAALGTRPESVSVTVMRSAEEALAPDALSAHLVLLDYQMPGRSGVELLSILRERPGGKDLRVIVASGSAGPEVVARFGLLGVTTFLHKPLAFPDLVGHLKAVGHENGWLLRHEEPETVAGKPSTKE